MPVTIGTSGRAVTPLRPTGFVDVNGTRLEAKLVPSRTAAVEIGSEVVIVGSDTFGLLVRAVGDVVHVSALPGFGEPIPTPAEQEELRHEDEQRVWEEEQEEAQTTMQKELLVFLIPMALAFAAGFVFFGVEGGFLFAFVWAIIFFGAAVLPSIFTG